MSDDQWAAVAAFGYVLLVFLLFVAVEWFVSYIKRKGRR